MYADTITIVESESAFFAVTVYLRNGGISNTDTAKRAFFI